MSTRSQIDFVSKWKDSKNKVVEERRRIYRHSDGYPEGVLPDLKEFLKWNSFRTADTEYTAANFIFWSKRRFEDYFLNSEWDLKRRKGKKIKWNAKEVEEDNNNYLKLGFGVCDTNEFHGDIEYFYEVITENGKTKIKVYEVDRKGDWDKEITMKEMKMKKIVKVG